MAAVLIVVMTDNGRRLNGRRLNGRRLNGRRLNGLNACHVGRMSHEP